jgi:hypothetical protein
MSDKQLSDLFKKYHLSIYNKCAQCSTLNQHPMINSKDKNEMQMLCKRVCGNENGSGNSSGGATIMSNGKIGIQLGGNLAMGFDGKIGIALT